jgi:hypothetical protein
MQTFSIDKLFFSAVYYKNLRSAALGISSYWNLRNTQPGVDVSLLLPCAVWVIL